MSNLYNLELTYAPGAQAPFLSAYIVRADWTAITAIQSQIAFTTVPVTENPNLLRNSIAVWWTGGRGITVFDKAQLLSGNVQYLLSVSYMTGGTPTMTPTFSVSPTPTATPSASPTPTATPTATPSNTPVASPTP